MSAVARATGGSVRRPVRATLTMRVAAADADAFAREWSRVAAWTSRQPGCLRQALCREHRVDDDGEVTFCVTSDWADEAAFRAFEVSSRQDVVTAGLRRLRRSLQMRMSTIVEHVPE